MQKWGLQVREPNVLHMGQLIDPSKIHDFLAEGTMHCQAGFHYYEGLYGFFSYGVEISS